MTRDRFLLILLVVWGLVMIVPDLVRFIQPLGSLGFYANSDGLIYDVTGPFKDKAASPASSAGIREGDRIDLSRMKCLPYDAVRCASVLATLGGLQYVLPGRVAVVDLAATPGHECEDRDACRRREADRTGWFAFFSCSTRSPASWSLSPPHGSCGSALGE